MNEGHSAFLAVERLRELTAAGDGPGTSARGEVRGSTVFTTHTPVPAGNEVFDPALSSATSPSSSPRAGSTATTCSRWVESANDPGFGLTPLALRLTAHANGVSELHGEVAREMWSPLWPGEDTPIGQSRTVSIRDLVRTRPRELLRFSGERPEVPPDEANW